MINKKGKSFIYHLHPVHLPVDSVKFTRTFGLGGMILLLFIIQVLSGLMMRFVYIPAPAEAYDSIIYINEKILFGKFIRNIHHISGILMVIFTFLHFIRVFLSQAFYKPRHFNWIIGIVLLICVIFSNFTGYLLPWDQLSYWAVTVSTSMLEYIPLVGKGLQNTFIGGNNVGAETLLNFYTIHTGILPVILLGLMIYHFWFVRKAKGIAHPDADGELKMVPSNPDLLLKELSTGLVLIAIVLIYAIIVDAPLAERANLSYSPNPAKAPWYFMGIQEMLMHIHPFFAVAVIPVLFIGGMISLPYVRISNPNPGFWFYSEKGKKLAIQSATMAAIITPVFVLADEYLLHFTDLLPDWPGIISGGLLPFVLLLFSLAIYVYYLRKKGAKGMEIIISVFAILIVSYLMLTICGIWFRGEGMKLVWPWLRFG